jgi:hypothetical protein
MAMNYIKRMGEMMLKEKMMRDPKNVEQWQQNREELKELLKNTTADHILMDKDNGFCPYIAYVTFDALNPKDYPHNIRDNSIYISFSIDFINRKVEVNHCGNIYLSEYDKTLPQYKYLCMKSMQDVLTDNGGKKFRKCSYKDMRDLANKMEKYYQQVMKEVKAYTGGYPYKQGIQKATETA